MTVRLSPCLAYARHVKVGACSCPFCGAKVACSDAAESDAPSTPPDASGAPSDAAAASDAPDERPGVVALYGGFIPIDASKDSG
jgi:hypothetical protein